MIDEWLNPVPRNPSEFFFKVTDLQENHAAVPTHVQLASVMAEAYWGTDYLSELASRYGWEAIGQRFLHARAGTQIKVRRGGLGEVVAVQYLKEVE